MILTINYILSKKTSNYNRNAHARYGEYSTEEQYGYAP